MSPARPATAAADHNLAHEQFPDLNHEFYRADPTDYIQRRVRALVISVADSPALADALVLGVRYRTIQVRREPDEESDKDAAEAYASLESTNLLHHAAECMLRLYLAHADIPPCPWLEVSRLRTPREFKERVEQLRDTLQEPETVDTLRTIFFGNPSPEPLGWSFTPEEWQRKTDGLVMLVEYLCTTVLGDAALYNATKHGLAVVGGNSGLKVSATGEELTISTEGPGLTYLDITPASAPGGRRWTKNLTFVRTEANLGLIEVIAFYIRSLWGIARVRYLGATEELPQIMQIEPDLLRKIIETGLEGPFGFAGMAQTLAYYVEEESDAAADRAALSQSTCAAEGSTAGGTMAGSTADAQGAAPSAERG